MYTRISGTDVIKNSIQTTKCMHRDGSQRHLSVGDEDLTDFLRIVTISGENDIQGNTYAGKVG